MGSRTTSKNIIMISDTLADRIVDKLDSEVIRRLLLRYFFNHGVEDMRQRVYPGIMVAIEEEVPELLGKIEVVPYAAEIDPRTGYGKFGWNLFVLGNQRMFLGYTEHPEVGGVDLKSLESLQHEGTSRNETTPQKIIAFVTRVLGKVESGRIRKVPQIQKPMMTTAANTGSAQFFTPNRLGRPEAKV